MLPMLALSPRRPALKKKAVNSTLLPPTIIGGTAPRQAETIQAHTDGNQLCVQALAALANNAQYTQWFGTFSQTRFNRVRRNYTKVTTRLETIPFTYNLAGAGCGRRSGRIDCRAA